jgi:hypothetical protein
VVSHKIKLVYLYVALLLISVSMAEIRASRVSANISSLRPPTREPKRDATASPRTRPATGEIFVNRTRRHQHPVLQQNMLVTSLLPLKDNSFVLISHTALLSHRNLISVTHLLIHRPTLATPPEAEETTARPTAVVNPRLRWSHWNVSDPG